MGVKLIIDSAADINELEAQKLGIIMIPMVISFNDIDYYDGVTIQPIEFYEKLIENNDLPKTSQVTSVRFEREFEKIVNNGDDVICITISSKLSGTYQSAVIAANNFEGKVHVIDSLNACIGERLLIQYALQLIKENKTAKEIADILNNVKLKINVLAMINTLEYLKKGGRISATIAGVGEMLSVKPVISVIDGEIKVIGMALGSKRANNQLNSLVKKKGGINFDMPYGIVWSGLDDSTLKKYVKDSSQLWENNTNNIPSYIIGCTIGTHIGPGAVGVAFFEK